MATTANPKGARAHARAMDGARVETMPIVPPVADDLPEGIGPDDLLWEETIAPGGYTGRRLARGSRLRLIDVAGDACASMLIFHTANPLERLNLADTVKVQWNAYPGPGTLLLSDMGRVLMSIVEDDGGTHDAFCGTSSERSNARRYGEGTNFGPYPNGRDRLMLAAGKFGLGRKDVHPCITWFKGIVIHRDGQIEPRIGPFAPGRAVVLRAEMDVIVCLANCPHVLDPRPVYTVSAVRATAWRGPITTKADPVRNATLEGLRAFLNVEDYLRT